MSSFAFLFPGQGSQTLGMGVELAENFSSARNVFARVDEALSQSLFALMRDGPDEQLRLTENAQPAIMAVSIAVMEVLAEDYGIHSDSVAFAAGHSLGEYSALCAARVFSLEDTARLLKHRGQAMQAAVPVGDGAMAALLGADMAQAEAAIEAGKTQGICAIANDNAPGQIVISGHLEAVETAIKAAQAAGIRRTVKLPVSAPFHCPLMQPAQEAMQAKFADTPIHPPACPIVCNVTAQPIQEPETIPELLCKQITYTVRWRESIEWLDRHGSVTHFAEIGHGNVLSGLNRRILPDAPATQPVGTREQIEALAQAWHAG